MKSVTYPLDEYTPLHSPHLRAINNHPRANVWLRRMFWKLSSGSGIKCFKAENTLPISFGHEAYIREQSFSKGLRVIARTSIKIFYQVIGFRLLSCL